MEMRQFGLLIKRMGADPGAFKLRKFVHDDRACTTVHVHGRGAATAYEVNHSQSWIAQFAADLARGLFGLESSAMPSAQTRRLLELGESRFASGGLQSGLAFLNDRVPHRFTAIYRQDGAVLRSVAMVDKGRSADAFSLQEVPVDRSFCQFVLKDGLFMTTQSSVDCRLKGHPYCGVVECYVGATIPCDKRGIYGTLCHFDFKSHELGDEEFLLLERVAQQILPRYLPLAAPSQA